MIHTDAIDDWLNTLTTKELRALQTAVDHEIQRRRDNAPPADARERVGRGRMFLATQERR
ncbi:MAG: hypothetical protein GX580_13065 [Candidatus Hydrogenedens sp.]|nr:hypothetical protein [Candidatus Hydrogenedens sp.]